LAAPVPVAVPTQVRGDPVGLAIVPEGGFADRKPGVKSASTTRTTPAIRKSVPAVTRAVAEEEFFCMGIFSSCVELISYETNNRNWNEVRMYFIRKIILNSRLFLNTAEIFRPTESLVGVVIGLPTE
jgi:hypothetical protein